jgi:hypothetical protein
MKYRRTIEWRDKFGPNSLTSQDYADERDALADVVARALIDGWTIPQWWQCWRWNESYWQWSPQEREAARDAATYGATVMNSLTKGPK